MDKSWDELDIVERLRRANPLGWPDCCQPGTPKPKPPDYCIEAINEIERLRRALRNASRELSPVRHRSPQYIYDDLLHEAAGGGDG